MVTTIQIVSIPVLFASGVLGCLLALWLHKSYTALIEIAESFAAGVFLATSLLHLLSDAVEEYDAGPDETFPMPYFYMCVGYIAVFTIEQLVNYFMARMIVRAASEEKIALVSGFSGQTYDTIVIETPAGEDAGGRGEPAATNSSTTTPTNAKAPGKQYTLEHNHGHTSTNGHSHGHSHSHGHAHNGGQASPHEGSRGRQAVGWVLLLALSAHSLTEGIALGVEHGSSLLIAILAHKWVEAFSLGCSFLRNSGLPPKRVFALLIGFSLITPIGIGIGLGLDRALEGREIGIIAALCAGSFMYVAALHSVKDSHDNPGNVNLFQLVALILGFGVMAIINRFEGGS